MSRALDVVAVGDAGCCSSASPILAAPRCIAIRLESRGSPIYSQRRVGKDGEPFDDAQAAHDGHGRRAHRRRPRGQRGRPAHHARRRASCAASRSTSCRTWSTCCAARWRSSARGRRSRCRSTSTPSASAAASRSSRHHRLGAGERPRVAAVARADRARHLVRRPPVARGSTSDPRDDRAPARDRRRASTRGRRADGRDDVAVLLTGVGKRYDIVSAFAEHAFTIAADPSPLAPAQYAADLRVAPPRIDDPDYVPFLAGARAASTTSARSCRSPTSTSRCSPRRGDGCPRSCPTPEIARDTYDKFATHELLAAPRAAVAADGAARRGARRPTR